MTTAKEKSIRTNRKPRRSKSRSRKLLAGRGKLIVAKNPRRKIDRFDAREIFDRTGIKPGTDFHSLRSEKVSALLEQAKRHGYKTPRNASGSRARMFFQMLERKLSASRRRAGVRVTPLNKNPKFATVRKPARKHHRRDSFSCFIVTFTHHGKRKFIGGSRGHWTLARHRKLAHCFATEDQAKNMVRANKKSLINAGIKSVKLIRTTFDPRRL